MKKRFPAIIAAALIIVTAASCTAQNTEQPAATQTTAAASEKSSDAENTALTKSDNSADTSGLSKANVFTDRDLSQTADLTNAKKYTVESGKDISITSEGVYVLSGNAENVTVTVDAGNEAKVQLVLDGLTVTNTDSPVIYVKSADKVFVTTASGKTNSLSVTGSFTSDGDTNTDAVIFSKDDLTLNGKGTLKINSTANGITGKDDLKLTGGTLDITSSADSVEANDSIAVAGGEITLNSQKDGLHAENDEDNTVGYIYICGGSLNINAVSDAIQGTTTVQVDDGKLNITAAEGVEGTYVKLNGGTINISASDDGINASAKSDSVSTAIEINGGDITVDMGQGDTDGIDSNGDLYINGGKITVNAQSPFDYDGTVEKNGGTLIVNGEETDTVTNQMMGGGHGGGMRGAPGGGMGGIRGKMQ
ncbi:MAG: carbohydrate-binding domain-containing protein [Ruminococcus sp.]|nr:carbohydrate-binding domain-containing protein [Ruminococcus sp.]